MRNRQNGTLFANFDRGEGENGLKIFENQHVDTKLAQKPVINEETTPVSRIITPVISHHL